ncbi:hypothetical protein DESUT3_17710 [Desulfuromonas versatilis]|uniref:Uncharacterized protein n=1 Tax=Desulfuromonas versatilis TaxID=2802975 RepID=A0ABN6DXW0_9BACT|nr:hypothetical protein [Desulfuromonas versatilis]BCR04702.1 hypothetical protein DESUT3_17710 [Desulfuromonas versatilis]
MSNPLYKIVFRGELAAGFAREEVEANLRARFRYSDAALAKLFSNRALALKGELDRPTALKFQEALERAGLIVEIQPMGAARPSPATGEECPQASDSPENAGPTREAAGGGEPAPSTDKEPEEAAASSLPQPQGPETQDASTEITAAEEAEDGAGQEGVILTEVIYQSMRQTRPWVRLIAILLFLGAVLGLLGSVAPLLAGLPGTPGAPPYLLVFLAQAIFCLFYLVPAWYLFKYAKAIGALLAGGGTAELESALLSQKSFWKFSGIMALVGLVLALVGVVAAVAIPMFMG